MQRVAILSPGEMGGAVAKMLQGGGLDVRTSLAGRSERTRSLARAAGVGEAATLEDLVGWSDLILSIVPPARALDVAREVAAALGTAGAHAVYADCNAVAPRTVRAAAALLAGTGCGFIDVGIIGSPPVPGGDTRLYASGPSAPALAELRAFGLDVRVIGDRVGDASAVKVSYAALTKGTAAIAAGLLLAARANGVYEPLLAELERSQPEALRTMRRQIPRVPSVAHRWAGEMEEIAKAFADANLTPRLFEGAAEIYRFAAASEIGAERPETRPLDRDMDATIMALASAISARAPD